jgi:hypothetical protein
MLNFFKYIFLKKDVFVKENETSFGIFQIFLFVEMESSKLNNYSTNSLFNYNICICMYIVGFAHYVQAMWIGTWYSLDRKILPNKHHKKLMVHFSQRNDRARNGILSHHFCCIIRWRCQEASHLHHLNLSS